MLMLVAQSLLVGTNWIQRDLDVARTGRGTMDDKFKKKKRHDEITAVFGDCIVQYSRFECVYELCFDCVYERRVAIFSESFVKRPVCRALRETHS
jgi:hypothetical protein